MDVFEAIESRIACRWFLDTPVDLNVVRNLIEGAARAASNGNLQPWNVHAATGEVLKEIKRQATAALEKNDWRTMETEYPALPENLCEPYRARNVRLGRELYGALGTSRDDRVGRDAQIKRNYQFFNAPVGLFITIDRRLGPGQWADLGGVWFAFSKKGPRQVGEIPTRRLGSPQGQADTGTSAKTEWSRHQMDL
jgi:nitroreductase